MSKQNNQKKVLSSQLAPVGGAAPLPPMGSPIVPNPVDRPDRREAARLVKPTPEQLTIGDQAAKEVRASTIFSSVIRPQLATQDGVANALEFATAWSREADHAEAWAAFARVQAMKAWDATLKTLGKIRPPLESAEASDPEVVAQLPLFIEVVTSRSVQAARAANRRKKSPKPSTTAASPPSPDGSSGSSPKS